MKFTNNTDVQPQKRVNAVILYIVVGIGTSLTVIVSLIILTKCLNWQRPPRGRQQAVPMRHVTANRSIQDDDGTYELARTSQMNGSAFRSQTDLSPMPEETQAWVDQNHNALPDSSEEAEPYYMSID